MEFVRYDIFISFKYSDIEGNKTKDYDIAKNLYDYLKEKGHKVFFSPSELEILGQSQYSKVIDEALDASRFLIVVGCSKENINSQWVQYEWDSFLNDIRSGSKPNGEVYVVYSDMNVNDLPRALRQRQAFDNNDNEYLKKLYLFIINATNHNNILQLDDHKKQIEQSKVIEQPSMQISCTATLSVKYSDGKEWTYVGELNNILLNGNGRRTWADGHVYEGDFVDGKYHGKGKYTWPSGLVYEGDFVNGKKYGKGKLTWTGGQVYEGDFVDDKYHGKGKMIYHNGDIYEGDWVNDKSHGKGKYTWANGNTYEGDFIDDKRVNGKYTWVNGFDW